MRRINRVLSFTAASAVVLVSSGSALAVTASPTPTTKKVVISCSNQSLAWDTLSRDVNGRVRNLKTARENGDAALAKSRTNENKARMNSRTRTLNRHAENIQRIKDLYKGDNDSLKAIKDYDTELRNAYNVYWHGDTSDVKYNKDTYAPNVAKAVTEVPSVDGAVADYRTKQDAAIVVRRGSVDTAIGVLRSDYQSAANQLKVDCANKNTKSNAAYNFKVAKNNAVTKYKGSYNQAQSGYRETNKSLKSNEQKTGRDDYIAVAKANFVTAKDAAFGTLSEKLNLTAPTTVNATFVAPPASAVSTSQSPIELTLQVDKGFDVSKVEWFLGSLDKKNMVTEPGVEGNVFQKHTWDISKLQTGKYKWFARVYGKDGKRYNVKAPDNKDYIEFSILKV